MRQFLTYSAFVLAVIITSACDTQQTEYGNGALIEASPDPVKLSEPTEELVVASIPPCYSNPDTLSVEGVGEAVQKLRECDPHRGEFTTDGRIAPWGGYGSRLASLQSLSRRFRSLDKVFNAMPVLERRELLRPIADIAAEYFVEYVHEDELRPLVLDLDWDRDIAPVNPEWYDRYGMYSEVDSINRVEWPGDSDERVMMPGTTLQLSRTELWVRLFWKRRGEAVFTTVKTATSAALATKG